MAEDDGLSPQAIAPREDGLYYHRGYWNDNPAVLAEINRRITGRSDQQWEPYFHALVGGRRFARALFLNCGNGLEERLFHSHGIFDNAVGVDISKGLLEEARALGAGLPISYVCMDTNAGVLPDGSFDLIVNNSAGHHIAFLDRVLRACYRALTPDGVFVNYDYVGAHRNQYPWQQWEAAWKLNLELPEDARQKLIYPHLPSMLSLDPSEAVHSDLVISTYERYFTIEQLRPSGGALAYLLLTFNEQLAAVPPERAASIVQHVMDADFRYLVAHPDSTMFAFWYGHPKRDVLKNDALLRRWEDEENAREHAAAAAGGRYYPPSLIESVMYAPEGTGVHLNTRPAIG